VGASDGLDVAIRERNADGIIDAIEAASHNVQSVFGGVEQHAACSRHCETAQAGDAGAAPLIGMFRLALKIPRVAGTAARRALAPRTAECR
jgi:hypothetical protein